MIVPPCPTAQPSFAETIKTELRFWPVGEATVLQLVPFHRMIVPPCPTAQPSSAILLLSVSSMNILLRTFPVGEATVLQLIPFHRMIVPAFPTAHVSVVEIAKTELRLRSTAGDGCTENQFVPFHRTTVEFPLILLPTAQPSA